MYPCFYNKQPQRNEFHLFTLASYYISLTHLRNHLQYNTKIKLHIVGFEDKVIMVYTNPSSTTIVKHTFCQDNLRDHITETKAKTK
jgi:hypothetical protein